MNFRDIRALITDLDGVLLRGNEPLPGMVALFDFLRQRGIPFIIATNNSTKTPAQYSQKFVRFGAAVVQKKKYSNLQPGYGGLSAVAICAGGNGLCGWTAQFA